MARSGVWNRFLRAELLSCALSTELCWYVDWPWMLTYQWQIRVLFKTINKIIAMRNVEYAFEDFGIHKGLASSPLDHFLPDILVQFDEVNAAYITLCRSRATSSRRSNSAPRLISVIDVFPRWNAIVPSA